MKKIIKGPKVTWIDISNATDEDINFLKENFKLHPLVLRQIIPLVSSPGIEFYKNYVFMTLFYPVHIKEIRETKARELDIIVTKNVLITSHYEPIAPLKKVLDKCSAYERDRKRYMSNNAGQLLFQLLNEFWGNCLIKLDRINLKVDSIEQEIFKGEEKKMVREISIVKTDLINFWRIVEPQREILESLAKEGTKFFGEEIEPYFSEIIGVYGKTWNGLKNFKETISAMEDTNESLLSIKTNDVIRVLTVFSVILLPLTLIASLWGMNVRIPLADESNGFWLILAAMVLLTGSLFAYFRKRKWL
jgi:magnesium transporter